MADWIYKQFAPCRVADIGGGKGLLAFFLRSYGFDAVVIDPCMQALPAKYKDMPSAQRVRLSGEEKVSRLTTKFSLELARNFDLLVGLHAHGSNLSIIEAAEKLGKSLVLLRCCVVGESAVSPASVSWFTWLVAQARDRGIKVNYFALNFKGQNLGFYGVGSHGALLRVLT